MSSDSAYCSLTELSRRLDAGETTSQDIVAGCLARIDALDGKLHAFIDVYRDDALAMARVADQERKGGKVRGPLHGLPIALKDLIHYEGRQTTAGSKSWLGRISDHTATALSKLLAAGHDSARQDAHGRVRVRRLGPQPADGRAVESVGHDDASRSRRVQQRLRRRRRGRIGAGGHRFGYRRIDPHSRVAVRPHRPQVDLRPHQSPRRGAAVDDARFARAARAHGRRRRAADRGDGRARCVRPGNAGRAALRRGGRTGWRPRRARHAHHRAGGRTIHRRCRSRRFARGTRR